MKTKGPPIFLFLIALIGAGVLVYVNFNQSGGPKITDMFNKLVNGVSYETAAPTEAAASSSTNESEGASVVTTTSESEETSASEEELDAFKAFSALSDMNVDRNLLTVNITLPAVGEITQDEVDEAVAKDIGLLSGVRNDDGSVTYLMSYFKYKDMLDETKKSIEDSLKETVDSDEFPNIVGITHNDDFTEYTIKYKGKDVALVDSFQVMACYMYSGMYAIFRGEPIDNVHVVFVNSETGDVISEANSRDMGKDSE